MRSEPLIVRLTLALILAGALGNVIDRVFYGVIFGEAPLFYGKVVDFIDMDFFHVNFLSIHIDRFAVFNVADSSISTGIVLMLLFFRKFSKVDESSVEAVESGKTSADQNPSISNVNEPKDNVQSSSVNLL